MSKYLSFSSWACGSFAAALLLLVLVAVPQKVLRAQTGGGSSNCTTTCENFSGSAYETCMASCEQGVYGGCPGDTPCNVSCSKNRTTLECSGLCNKAAGCDPCKCTANEYVRDGCACQ